MDLMQNSNFKGSGSPTLKMLNGWLFSLMCITVANFGVVVKAGLWTLDWTMDWTLDSGLDSEPLTSIITSIPPAL